MNSKLSSVSPAFVADFDLEPHCVYSNVVFNETPYCVQISRPRHPAATFAELDEGADIHTDEGHDDNFFLKNAVTRADADWDDVVEEILIRSEAQALLDSLRAA